jgi:hypothetical protein
MGEYRGLRRVILAATYFQEGHHLPYYHKTRRDFQSLVLFCMRACKGEEISELAD